ncbi:MAG: DUF5979 domain-containing protein [Pseudoclavibacter sp.]|nr:DUF5979 domain-containing protein [Pseudoclavibacter sp.]
MNTAIPTPRGSGARVVAAIVALLTLLASLFFGSAAAAHADSNPRIQLSNLSLVKSDVNGNLSTSPVQVQDVLKFTFDWDGGQADIRPGDSFQVELPATLRVLEFPQSRPLEVEHGGQQVGIGQCVLEKQRIVCTFDEAIQRLRAQGYHGFSGSGSVLLKAMSVWREETIEIDLNGTKTPVPLPPGGIKEREGVKYTPWSLGKSAGIINAATKKMHWEINFGKTAMEQIVPSQSLNGTERHTFVFTDTLGPGHRYNEDPATWNIMVRNSAAEPELSGQRVADASGKDYELRYGDFDLSVSVSGQTATITATGPFRADTNYKIYYQTLPTTENGLIQPGFKYTNEASMHGFARTARFERYYSQTFSINVKMEAGFGGFDVTKLLAGDGAGEVAEGTGFTVKVKYTLPGGATTDAYPNWSAPGAVAPDKTGGVTEFRVAVGQKNTYNGTFPAGTRIELSEDPASASPASDTIRWGAPAFKIGNGEGASFEIGDRTSTPVELTNTAELALGTFTVAKTVSGAQAADKQFAFGYECTDGQSGSLRVPGDGTPVTADKRFPLGTECTITEDAASAQLEGYKLDAPAAQTVTVASANEPVAVAFANAYARQLGEFTIAKTVTGGDFAGEAFAFAYRCTDGSEGVLRVPGDGTPVSSGKLPAGTECAISEDAAAAEREGYALTAKLSQQSVRIGDGTVVAVTAENVYTRETGTFRVAKAVESNDGSDYSAHVFEVRYVCTDGSEGVLRVPGDGTAAAGPELPTGTECTVSETEESRVRAGYSVATSIDAPTFRIVKDAPVSVTVTNSYTRHVGGFTVAKNVSGDGAALAPAEFVFDYACTDAAGQPTVNGSLSVAAGRVASVEQVPTGSCRVTERDARIGDAQLETRLSVNGSAVDGAEANFEVREGATVEVAAENAYTLDRGGFQLVKTVVGDDVETHAARDYVFDYVCSDGASGTVTVRGDGTPAAADARLPIGTTCTVTERAAEAQAAGYDVAVPAAQELTIAAKDQIVELSFENRYTRHTGSFQVVKTVTGAQAPEGTEFVFDYQCTDGTNGTLRVAGDGTPTGPEQQLPLGTECTIAEQADAAQLDGYTLRLPEAQTVRIEQKDQTVELSFVNAYEPVVTPTPEPTPGEGTPPAPGPSPEGGLATTGAQGVAVLIGLALASLLAGAVTVLIRRRRA